MDGEGILGMDGEGGQARALCHRDGTPVPRLSLHSPTILSQEILPQSCHKKFSHNIVATKPCCMYIFICGSDLE